MTPVTTAAESITDCKMKITSVTEVEDPFCPGFDQQKWRRT